MLVRTRIIDVERKPIKCPVCGSEVWDIIYGTGDMTEVEFFLTYNKPAIMGGDNIPRRPPIWAWTQMERILKPSLQELKSRSTLQRTRLQICCQMNMASAYSDLKEYLRFKVLLLTLH